MRVCGCFVFIKNHVFFAKQHEHNIRNNVEQHSKQQRQLLQLRQQLRQQQQQHKEYIVIVIYKEKAFASQATHLVGGHEA